MTAASRQTIYTLLNATRGAVEPNRKSKEINCIQVALLKKVKEEEDIYMPCDSTVGPFYHNLLLALGTR